MPLCATSPQSEMSGFPMGSGGQGRLSLHVSCCSVSFFQLSMSHELELKVSETSTWLEKVGLCSIVVELCGICAGSFWLQPSRLSNANTDGFGKDA